MRKYRPRWYRHVIAEEDSFLKRAMNLEMEGRGAREKPKKTWRRCVDEDMENQM